MNNIKRILSLGVLLGALAGSLTACNTMEGAGKDIEKAGEEIQEEANENR
jgi:predicted small secreted protein